MLGIFLSLTGGLFVATYQPLISTYVSEITAQRQKAFWTPPQETVSKIPKSQSTQPQVSPSDVPTPKKPIYLGIFGDSTNQCCSATGAFWPRLLARNFNWQYSDYTKPATTFISSGVGNNDRKIAHPSKVNLLRRKRRVLMSFQLAQELATVRWLAVILSRYNNISKKYCKILEELIHQLSFLPQLSLILMSNQGQIVTLE